MYINTFNRGSTFNKTDENKQRLINLEDNFRAAPQTFGRYFLKGTLRTNRPAPANSTDVANSDQLYDRILTNAYEYILIDNAGALEWRRIAISVF